MEFGKLRQIIDAYNIPSNVRIYSDTGWECDALSLNYAYYSREKNAIVFTCYKEKKYNDWWLLYSEEDREDVTL